jgi:hypothetical protein
MQNLAISNDMVGGDDVETPGRREQLVEQRGARTVIAHDEHRLKDDVIQ